jgi:hypothetical protein
MEPMQLYEILVPATKPPILPGKHRFFSVRYHRLWDAKVIAIAKGLTVLQPNKGSWLSPRGELCNDRVIPVRISCTKDQIQEIMDITAKHYYQQAVMAYKVSDEVIIKHYS